MKTISEQGTTYEIKTNNVPRDLKTWNELPESVRNDFDYAADASDEMKEFDTRFFQYKGTWYDANEFMRCSSESILKDWDGYETDTYFSGTLLRYVGNDQARVIVARFYC